MPRSPSDSPPASEERATRTPPSRVTLLTLGGLVSGWFSGRWVQALGDTYQAERWLPGACFALWTVAATWGPAALATRPRVKHSPAWNLGIFAGVILAYVAAYYVAEWVVLLLPAEAGGISLGGSRALTVGGLAGGAVGSAALVNLWSLLFSPLGDLRTRSILIAWGTLLGAFLALSRPDYVLGDWSPSPTFFVTWQGGMALALGLADRFSADPASA